jgi:hypothetical protein
MTATADDAPHDERAALSLTDLLLNGMSPQEGRG